MNFLVSFDVAPDLLDGSENNAYALMLAELNDFLAEREDVKVNENVWAVKAKRQRTNARHVKNYLLDKILKDFDSEVKKQLRMFVTPIHPQNHGIKDPICDTESGVRGMLEWFITN